jgi:acyl-CoA thioester hydrolase
MTVVENQAGQATGDGASADRGRHGPQLQVRVYYEDTDAGGVVYHTNYIKYFERARTEWLRSLGFTQSQLLLAERVLFSVVSLSTQFRRPARLDDALTVRTRAELAGGASVRFLQEVWRDGANPELLATGDVMVACIDAGSFRPRRLPESLRKELV